MLINSISLVLSYQNHIFIIKVIRLSRIKIVIETLLHGLKVCQSLKRVNKPKGTKNNGFRRKMLKNLMYLISENKLNTKGKYFRF